MSVRSAYDWLKGGGGEVFPDYSLFFPSLSCSQVNFVALGPLTSLYILLAKDQPAICVRVAYIMYLQSTGQASFV